jgi:hypothetical protein
MRTRRSSFLVESPLDEEVDAPSDDVLSNWSKGVIPISALPPPVMRHGVRTG